MREIQRYRYLVAALLTVIMFTMGVLVSNFVDDARTSSLQSEIQQDLVEIESKQLQLTYLKSGEVQSCDVLKAGLNNIVSGYNRRLGNLQQYKEESVLQEQRFKTIRDRYILSGIRYWMFAQDLRQRCDYSPDTVLFFANSLDQNDSEQNQRQARQLTLLKKERRSQILIFTIPRNMEDGMVKILERQYNVTESPTLVLNGEEKLVGYHSRSEIREHLDNRTGG
ncbi:MAG: hypothetical protein ABEJ64_03365 [Candidatus Nanohaloarchaea archaeon]